VQNIMPALDSANARAARRHSHKPNGSAGEALCPYCGQPVSRKEFKEIRARIEAEERARFAEIEKTLRQRFARERQEAAVATQQAIEKAKKNAAAHVEKAKREAAAREAKIRQEATNAATAALSPKIAEAVNAEKQRAYAEKLSLEQQLADVQRRLQRKSAHDLGEPAEIDLHKALVTAFPADTISRVPRGQRGPDVIVKVVHSGDVVGSIVLDSKNHKRWSKRLHDEVEGRSTSGGRYVQHSLMQCLPEGRSFRTARCSRRGDCQRS
jgi:multidrug efflux pump subunit AcrA (membrane-fusion protein)